MKKEEYLEARASLQLMLKKTLPAQCAIFHSSTIVVQPEYIDRSVSTRNECHQGKFLTDQRFQGWSVILLFFLH